MSEHQSEWTKSMSTKEQIHVVKRMIGYTKPYWHLFIPSIILSLVLAAVNMVLPRIIQQFIDNYLELGNTSLNIFFFFAMLYFATVIVKAIIWFFQYSLYLKGSVKTSQSIRLALYNKVQSLGMRYFDQTPAGSIVSRVTNDTETLVDFWFVFQSVLTGVFGMITGVIAMWLLSPALTLKIIWFIPLLLIIVWYYQKFSSRVYRQMREKLSQLNTKLNESISGMSIIQQFRQEKRLEEEFEAINDDYLQTKTSMIRTNSLLLAPVINLLVATSTALVLYYFGNLSLNRLIDIGMIYAFITYVQTFFQPMINMMDYLSVFQDGIVASSRILKIMDHDEVAPQQNEQADAKIVEGKVEFRNVSFAYDGEHQVLKNISFVANPGETVALVGHTGSGKSSIINVLMRFYEFYDGEILIDDRDIRDFPMEELRDKLGLVLQEAFMFYGDIKSNIRLLDQSITDEEIIEAAKFVQADKFIESLPDGYDSKVIERGASYSSGQRQLLSFARTIVADPKILVLDEATANIDTETEGLIQEGLKRMRKGRTTIAIAHRLSTIKDANLILVLDKGRIVEQGTHDELIAHGGLYFDMYQLQQKGE
ncbi:ABC transporter ATP-binding protein [Vagococcus xieshaowenii]|uniref:ABC transporter ATP-binding protein n=1 Tax=Vagococcus xieshaowenii TaxID=2562451 RepID=A0AAJ5EF10_9ENTE|nr:ABC transporter ATP-binding protein [Vagococcus xieshaowenii]QCA28643.1 ABC transporter ATP-binding protein [Vagococcus xieshaowenii]TFZ40549.1 ABC transporter ATP-binding protein [Vagococcus xieshaowenii]